MGSLLMKLKVIVLITMISRVHSGLPHSAKSADHGLDGRMQLHCFQLEGLSIHCYKIVRGS